jgi:hypothetical protein
MSTVPSEPERTYTKSEVEDIALHAYGLGECAGARRATELHAPRDIVDEAVGALAAFGGVITRDQAAMLLSMWCRAGRLAPSQRREVLRMYPRRIA